MCNSVIHFNTQKMNVINNLFACNFHSRLIVFCFRYINQLESAQTQYIAQVNDLKEVSIK